MSSQKGLRPNFEIVVVPQEIIFLCDFVNEDHDYLWRIPLVLLNEARMAKDMFHMHPQDVFYSYTKLRDMRLKELSHLCNEVKSPQKTFIPPKDHLCIHMEDVKHISESLESILKVRRHAITHLDITSLQVICYDTKCGQGAVIHVDEDIAKPKDNSEVSERLKNHEQLHKMLTEPLSSGAMHPVALKTATTIGLHVLQHLTLGLICTCENIEDFVPRCYIKYLQIGEWASKICKLTLRGPENLKLLSHLQPKTFTALQNLDLIDLNIRSKMWSWTLKHNQVAPWKDWLKNKQNERRVRISFHQYFTTSKGSMEEKEISDQTRFKNSMIKFFGVDDQLSQNPQIQFEQYCHNINKYSMERNIIQHSSTGNHIQR